MHILLLGCNGQVGWELQRSLAPFGRMTALDHDSAAVCGDLSDLVGLSQTIRDLKPDVIVNAAAYTAVDKAESEPEYAVLLNAAAVEVLAKEAEAIGAWLVHYSTDYVFDGRGDKPWEETDTPEPLNVYGKTKLAGELAIQNHCSKYLIFRTSWVYAARGNNFAKTMLRLGREKTELSVINDQFGAPTGAELLADCTAHAIVVARENPKLADLYHLTASGTTSWYEYALLVFDCARKADVELAMQKLHPVATSAFPIPATRPHNSRLNTDKFQKSFGLVLPAWQQGVKRMLDEILGE
ncbi:dTDP-4-dehydrorhamnose reductase [Dongshaea marina]|uniref:dTDP-4-dehydrorhamnose reductase n=1 Tax=Dongshaea marina TaxID=2047966 RepID=UPI000D3E1C81|nr:dTDP-4-dehydrorhamnose reductase [Dongshaea marina]